MASRSHRPAGAQLSADIVTSAAPRRNPLTGE